MAQRDDSLAPSGGVVRGHVCAPLAVMGPGDAHSAGMQELLHAFIGVPLPVAGSTVL